MVQSNVSTHALTFWCFRSHRQRLPEPSAVRMTEATSSLYGDRQIHCALNNFRNDIVAQRDEVGSDDQNDVLLFAIRCDIDAVEEVRRFTAVEREDRVVHDLMTELCGSEGVSPAEREVV